MSESSQGPVLQNVDSESYDSYPDGGLRHGGCDDRGLAKDRWQCRSVKGAPRSSLRGAQHRPTGRTCQTGVYVGVIYQVKNQTSAQDG